MTALWDVVLRLFATKKLRILGIEKWNWVHVLEGYFNDFFMTYSYTQRLLANRMVQSTVSSATRRIRCMPSELMSAGC